MTHPLGVGGGKVDRWLPVAAALLLLGTSSMSINGPSGPTVVAYGDSYMAPNVLGEAHGQRSWLRGLDRPVINRGHAGDCVEDLLKIVERSPRTTQDVVLEIGINDVYRFGDAEMASFVDDFGTVLDLLSGARRVVVVLPLPIRRWGPRGSEEALLLHRAAEREIAASHPNARVVDAMGAWQADTMLLADGIHPDVPGREVLATAVMRALRAR